MSGKQLLVLTFKVPQNHAFLYDLDMFCEGKLVEGMYMSDFPFRQLYFYTNFLICEEKEIRLSKMGHFLTECQNWDSDGQSLNIY